MAKKRSSSSRPGSGLRRPLEPAGVRRLPDLSLVRPLSTVLRELEDRRTFHPDGGLRVPVAFRRSSAKLVASRVQKWPVVRTWNDIPVGVSFSVPFDVLRCVRRKVRKEVIHALRLTGKGAGAKRRRRDDFSNVRC